MPVVPESLKYTGLLREVLRYINQYGVQNWSVQELSGGVGGWLGITGPVKIAGMEFVNLPMSVYIKKTDDTAYWISENSYPQGWKGYDWIEFVAQLSRSPYVTEVGIIEEDIFGYKPPLGYLATSSPSEMLAIAYEPPKTAAPPTPGPAPTPTPTPLPASWPYYLALAGIGVLGVVVLAYLIREIRG